MTIERVAVGEITGFVAAVGDWYAAHLALPAADTLRITFRERTSGDEITVTVLPRDAPGPVFKRLTRCAIRYSVRIAELNDRRRAEVSALLLAVSGSIDSRLATGQSLAEVLGGTRSPRRVVFGREMLRDLLAPEIVEGSEVAGGFALHDVYPSSQRRLEHKDELELIVELRRDLRRVLFAVGPASDRPALIRTKNFSVVELVGARADSSELEPLRALVSFIFQLKDHDALEVVFPSVIADLGLRALPLGEQTPRVEGSLNLALDAECGQQCAFCSVKDHSPAFDGGDAVLARALSDLRESRARGVRHLRLNGYDPLAFSGVLDVTRAARDLGYERVDVFSPSTRLADRTFCEELLATLPAARTFHVPLYSVEPAAHDAFVGRSGAHRLVMQAIDHLVTLAGEGAVKILSVATVHNLAELRALHSFAQQRGLSFSAHTPYPIQEGRDDRFFSSVARQSDLAEVIADIHDELGPGRHDVPIFGVAPCVSYRVFGARNVSPWRWLAAAERAPLPGTEYDRDDIAHGGGDRATGAFRAATVPCSHRARCALSTECGGELLRAYVERYGTEEFMPIGLRALVEAIGAPASERHVD